MAGVVGGALTGAQAGCAGLEAIGFGLGGPPVAAIGCSVGLRVGLIAGGLTGAVVAGCFD